MKKETLLSVIVPVYKVEEYLTKCLDSIINQTYKNLEIILVDDGSPDACPQICDEYAKKDKRIKVIHKQNGGVSSARNMGLDVAKGEFITFVDSDDWIDDTMYEKMMKKQAEEDLDLILVRYKSLENGTITNVREEQLDDFCKENNLKYLINIFTKSKKEKNILFTYDYIMGSIWRMVFRKSSIGNIRFDSNIKIMEDCVFLFQLILKHKIRSGFVDEYLYNYIIRDSSAMATKGKVIVENSLFYEKKVINLFKNSPYEYMIRARLFLCYIDCVESKYRHGFKNIDLSEVKHLNSRENYKQLMKIKMPLKARVRAFCVHHGLFFIIQLWDKLR